MKWQFAYTLHHLPPRSPCIIGRGGFLYRVSLLACLLSIMPGGAIWAGAEDPLLSASQQYRDELEGLANWCDDQGLTMAAQRTRNWPQPDNGRLLYLVDLPLATDPLPIGAEASEAEQQWRARFLEVRREYSEALFEAARQAIRSGHISTAYELVLQALREDPNHAQGRKLLGYVEHEGVWRTPWEIRRLKAGQVDHPRYGWLPAQHVPRYEAGERYQRGRWVSAEEDARSHEQIRQGWHIETEHYDVLTNHSLEAGVELGRKLERLYRVWQQAFAPYNATREELIRRFEGRGAVGGNAPRHRVVYFRNRDEYNAALRSAQPNIDITIGIYFDSTRTAYFFAGKEYDDTTLFHEATHQLFSETRPTDHDVGARANYWIVEGISLYMESLADLGDGRLALGDPQNIRFRAAHHRLLVDDYYVPLGELCRYGRNRLQSDKDISRIYSQATGLTHFLMHYEDGRYRDAVVAYLLAVYTGRANPTSLARLTGVSYEELDRQYREFMRQQ